jgi:hypothetical protein
VAGRRDQIAESPAGHREGLREAVQHEGAVGVLEDRAVAPALGEAVVDLVGDDEGGPLLRQRGDDRHPLRRQHRSGGITWRVDQDGPRAGSQAGPDGLGTILEAILFGRVHVNGHALGVTDEVRIAGVVRIAEDDLVARIEERAEQQEHRRRRAGRHQHLVR